MFYLNLIYSKFSTSSWRLSFSSATFCNSALISSGSLFGIVADIVCISNCFTASEVVGTTAMQCSAFSSVDDWSYGSYTWQHTFPLSNDIEFSYSGSAWASLVVGGSSATWDIKLKINTLNRTDTGKVNSSPQTIMAPMVIVRQGFDYALRIPYTDSDSTDTVRCRWSLAANGECAGEHYLE
jgi:hypothetical protein